MDSRRCIMNTNTDYAPMIIPFHNAQLNIVDYKGQPYIPMKPIVEGMGLNWNSQIIKLKQRFAKGVVEITTPTKGGNQTMICLPLRKLFGWLMTISPNKVKPQIKETIIKYQDECDDVLWSHWAGKLNAQRKAFDEFNKISFDEKLSRAKGSMHSYGMLDRKEEKRVNAKRLEDWKSKNVLTLDFADVNGVKP